MSSGGIAFSTSFSRRWLSALARHRLARWLVLPVLLAEANAFAHDPFEITSRAYVYSNHLELRIEMEFPAAMLLANQGSASADASAPADQFALALPQLQARAADFLHVTAAGRRLAVSSTNVSLGLENHVRFILKLPVTEASGLKFEVGELKTLSEHGNYGTSLTVVDMVRNEVLGQSVLFGDSPPLELEGAIPTSGRSSNPPVVVHVAATNLMPASAEPPNQNSPPPARSIAWLLLLGCALVTSFVLVLKTRNGR